MSADDTHTDIMLQQPRRQSDDQQQMNVNTLCDINIHLELYIGFVTYNIITIWESVIIKSSGLFLLVVLRFVRLFVGFKKKDPRDVSRVCMCMLLFLSNYLFFWVCYEGIILLILYVYRYPYRMKVEKWMRLTNNILYISLIFILYLTATSPWSMWSSPLPCSHYTVLYYWYNYYIYIFDRMPPHLNLLIQFSCVCASSSNNDEQIR